MFFLLTPCTYSDIFSCQPTITHNSYVKERKMTNKEYWLYLSRIKGLESGRRNVLLGMLGSPEEIYRASEKTLKGIPLLEEYHVEQLIGERRTDYGAEIERLDKLGIGFVTDDDEDFPEKLKNIPDAPAFLFYKGELPKESEPAVAVVGSRKCSYYICGTI